MAAMGLGGSGLGSPAESVKVTAGVGAGTSGGGSSPGFLGGQVEVGLSERLSVSAALGRPVSGTPYANGMVRVRLAEPSDRVTSALVFGVGGTSVPRFLDSSPEGGQVTDLAFGPYAGVAAEGTVLPSLRGYCGFNAGYVHATGVSDDSLQLQGVLGARSDTHRLGVGAELGGGPVFLMTTGKPIYSAGFLMMVHLGFGKSSVVVPR
jgi:hypothetical protein